MAETSNQQTVQCRIKWFDARKGFGFMVPEDGGADVLLHANVLRNIGMNTIAEGVMIKAVVVEVNGKWQAASVLAIIDKAGSAKQVLAESAEVDPEVLQSLPYQPARVKWFDSLKGIGFANVFGLPEDVFIHIEVLRGSGMASLVTGDAVALRVIKGARGYVAVEITDWYQKLGQSAPTKSSTE